jgi:hypothetical protein
MVDLFIAILDALLCLGVGLYARRLGRHAVFWFLLSLFLITPVFAFPLLFLMGPHRFKYLRSKTTL